MFDDVDAKTIQTTRETLGLKQAELARALNIAAFTVRRWESGKSFPTGLQHEVLRGLHEVASRVPPDRALEIGDLLRGGVGTVLRDCLVEKETP